MSEISKRRLAYQFREPVREYGTGGRHATRKRGDRPRLGRLAVEQRESPADLRVSHRGQPSEFSRVRVFFEVRAHGLYEEDVGQSSDYFRGSDTVRVEFGQDMLDL